MPTPTISNTTIVAVMAVDGVPGTPGYLVEASRSCRVLFSSAEPAALADGRIVGMPAIAYTASDKASSDVVSVLGGLVEPNYGTLELENADGALDGWSWLYWRQSGIVAVYVVDDSTPPSDTVDVRSTTPTILARVKEFKPGDRTSLTLSDQRTDLFLTPFARSTYRGHQHAVRFDGTADYADTDAAKVDVTEAWTVEMWVRQNAANGTAMDLWTWGDDDDATNTEAVIRIAASTKKLQVLIPRQSGSYPSALEYTHPFKYGDPFQVAVTTDATACKVYVNGVLVASGPGGAYTAGSLLVTLAKRINKATNYAPITVDDVRLWSVVRTADEIKASMRALLKGDETGLVHCWEFSDAAGTTVADITTTTTPVPLTLYDDPAWIGACEGTRDMAGSHKRRLLGPGLNVKCLCIDPFRDIYQIADGPLGDLGLSTAVGAELFFDVRDKGTSYTKEADYDSLDTFLTTDPSAGSFISCLRHGLVKVASVNGEVTADCYGETLHSLYDDAGSTVGELPYHYACRFDSASSEHGTVSLGWSNLGTSFSFSCWFRLDSVAGGPWWHIMSNLSGSTAGRRYLRAVYDAPNGKYSVECGVTNDAGGGTSAVAPYGSVQPNRWYHVRMGWNATTLTLYLWLNGVLVAEEVQTGAFTTAANATTYIGQSSGGTYYWHGDLSMIQADAASAVAPTATSTTNPMACGPSLSGAPHFYGFTEGTGTSVASSPAGANITLVNTPSWAPGPSPDFAAAWLEHFVGTSFSTVPPWSTAWYEGLDPTYIEATFLSLPGYQLHYAPEPDADVSVADFLNEMLLTFSASLGPNYAGRYTILRMASPGYEFTAGGAAVAADTSAAVPVYSGQVAAINATATQFPPGRIKLGFRRLAYVQDAGSLDPTVDAALRASWAREVSYHSALIPDMMVYADPPAPDLIIDTLAVRWQDAVLLLAIFVELYGSIVQFHQIDLGGVEDVIPGAVLDLTLSGWDRHDVPNYPLFRVVSANVNHDVNTASAVVFRS